MPCKCGCRGDFSTGVDPLKEETYRAAMDYFKGLVDEYERLVDARLQK